MEESGGWRFGKRMSRISQESQEFKNLVPSGGRRRRRRRGEGREEKKVGGGVDAVDVAC